MSDFAELILTLLTAPFENQIDDRLRDMEHRIGAFRKKPLRNAATVCLYVALLALCCALLALLTYLLKRLFH